MSCPAIGSPANSPGAPIKLYPAARHILQNYYLATPLFASADIVFGANLRATGFEAYPALKWFYYLACFLCFWAMYAHPQLSSIIALTESSINIVVLVLAYLGPLYITVESVAEGLPVQNPLTAQRVINFILAGSAACLAFYSHQPTREN